MVDLNCTIGNGKARWQAAYQVKSVRDRPHFSGDSSQIGQAESFSQDASVLCILPMAVLHSFRMTSLLVFRKEDPLYTN
jgi:hypothetical protein